MFEERIEELEVPHTLFEGKLQKTPSTPRKLR
jgi:hypothetical protein